MSNNYNDNFYDDASSIQDPFDNTDYYDSQVPHQNYRPQRTSIFSGYFSKKPKRQIEATLGGPIGNCQRDTMATQKSGGTLAGLLGSYDMKDYPDNNSDFNTTESAGIEKQVANLTYVDPPKPLYDPNNRTEAKVPAASGMIIPIMLDYSTQQSNEKNYVAPIEPVHNNYAVPVSKTKDVNREKRIRELKTEIDQLDQKLAMDQKQERNKSRRCCCCCPTSRRGRMVLFVIIMAILGGLGLLLYFFWPKVPQFKVKTLQVFRGISPVINITEDQSSFRFAYALNLTVEVINSNRYGIKTDLILMNAYISPNMTELAKTNYPGNSLTGKVDDHLVGKARSEGIEFPAQSAKTFFAKLSVDFFPDPDLGILGDPAIGEIIRVCTPEARKRKELMKIIYEVEVKIGVFSRFGFTPKILDEVTVGCPLGDRNAESLFKQKIFSVFLNNNSSS